MLYCWSVKFDITTFKTKDVDINILLIIEIFNYNVVLKINGYYK